MKKESNTSKVLKKFMIRVNELSTMNTTEPTSEGSKRSKAKGNRILYCESCKAYKAENADLRAALAELISMVESERSFYISDDECGLLEHEYLIWKSAIERAKRITNGQQDKD